jgi:hypothetical protein
VNAEGAPATGEEVAWHEPPFGPSFFASVLPDRVTAACEQEPARVPVVLVRLGDGTLLDLCHVTALTPQYLVTTIYRDPSTCEDMDVIFVPYSFITWVRVALHDRATRPLGFDVSRGAADHGHA